ncbi:MAG TPA: hypothetical protein VIC63_04690 [Candidatus Limnocylindria bacterium]|jgi:hypothetical protein
MASIHVSCAPVTDGWTCQVTVGDDAGATHHEVAVEAGVLGDLAPPGTTPAQLVEASFAFLLEREPRGSILGRFDLPVIGRYFPEFPTVIRERLEA